MRVDLGCARPRAFIRVASTDCHYAIGATGVRKQHGIGEVLGELGTAVSAGAERAVLNGRTHFLFRPALYGAGPILADHGRSGEIGLSGSG